MIVIRLDVDWRLFVAVLLGLGWFGAAYAAFVYRLGDRQEGYTALLVVGGVLVTLIGVAIVDLSAAIMCLLAFAASGTPMIVGSIYRYVQLRDQARERMRDGKA